MFTEVSLCSSHTCGALPCTGWAWPGLLHLFILSQYWAAPVQRPISCPWHQSWYSGVAEDAQGNTQKNVVYGNLCCLGVKPWSFAAGGAWVKVEMSPYIAWTKMEKMTAAQSGPPGHGGCLVVSPEPTRMCLYPPFNFTFTKALLSNQSPCSRSPLLHKTALSKVCQRSPIFLGKETWRNPQTHCVGESCSSSGQPVWCFHCEGQHLCVQLSSPGMLVDPAGTSHLLWVEFGGWNGSCRAPLGIASAVSPLSLLEARLACLLAVVSSRSSWSWLLQSETRELLYRGVWQGSRCLWQQFGKGNGLCCTGR